jgi:hypothetical protein
MTLTTLSDGDSSLILSTNKGDEESGEFNGTTTNSLDPISSRTEQTKELIDEFPTDGGLEGWTCVVGGWFALFATFGWLNSWVSSS